MKPHSYLDLTREMFVDLLDVSWQWYGRANQKDGRAKYPSMAWDLLIHAGASKVHPHFHLYLDRRRHQGHFGQLTSAAASYHRQTGRDYWEDTVQLHLALGLGLAVPGGHILVPLTSRKDNEFLVVYRGSGLAGLGHIIHQLVATYTTELSVYCWNMGVAWPVMHDGDGPTLLRIGARGDCSSVRSDVSSLELYTFYSLNVDPYQTLASLKKHVQGNNTHSSHPGK